jgi:cytochrome c oxidase assembly protein subunit 15
MTERSSTKLETWTLALLAVTVFVILWGAFVRVTGSGAGCADHWPLCNGELVPHAPRIETLIELTHRLTSGVAGILSLVVTWLAFQRTPRGAPVRTAAALAFALMLVEGAIGALLVKKGLVDKNASGARAIVVGLHLGNTFLLLGAQLLTWHFARGGSALRMRERPALGALLLTLLGLVLAVGASGAVTALGDTLFPAESLSAGMHDDFAEGAHFLVRLRVWHPLLALVTGVFVVLGAQYVRNAVADPAVARTSSAVIAVFIAQVGLGSLNLVLLAPAWVQILHLLLADLLWLSLVLLAAQALSAEPVAAQSLASAAS